MLPQRIRRSLLAALVILGAGAAVSAQQRSVDLADQFVRVEREFERTREVLERVGPMVAEANVPRAKEQFGMSLALQTKGRAIFERAQGTQDRPLLAAEMLREALSLTLRARDLAQRAGAMLREQVGFEERAQRAIEQLERRIERAREREVDTDTRGAALLAEATQQLESARKHYADHNFEVSYRIADAALRLLNGLPGEADQAGPGGDRFLRELRRTEALLERVRERDDALDANGQRLLEQAANLLDEAKGTAQQRDMRRAQAKLDEAQRILRQLLDHNDVNAQDVQRALERFDAALTRLHENHDPLSNEAEQLVVRARSERESAQAALERGDEDRALTRLRSAMDLLDRARRLSGAN